MMDGANVSYDEISDECIESLELLAKDVIEKNVANGSEEVIELDYELGTSDKRNLKKHNELYTKLLRQYVNNFIEVSKSKKRYKKIFIELLLVIMVGIPIVVFSFLYYAMESFIGQEYLPTLITGTLTSLVSLVSVFVSIPKIITKYLFNEKEEENMTIIIKNIQDYDKQIRFTNSIPEDTAN